MIQVSHLSFSYTKKPFIQDMTFSVSEGEIFGFLGPSGAGKSILQKILLGMLPGYQCSARVNGTECNHRGADFYESIGVDFEFSTLYEKLSAKENLQFFSSLYRRQARSIPELLARVGLENDGDKRVSDYSKGMKSRLNFVKVLLHDPQLLFLDEPTSGLDPTNSRLMKDMILEEKGRGKTILLTTHNMLDAAELCDRVAFIIGLLIVTISSNKLEGMAVTKLSSLMILGAVLPCFVPAPFSFGLSYLPSFWMGKAMVEGSYLYLLPSVAAAGLWGAALWMRSYRVCR